MKINFLFVSSVCDAMINDHCSVRFTDRNEGFETRSCLESRRHLVDLISEEEDVVVVAKDGNHV